VLYGSVEYTLGSREVVTSDVHVMLETVACIFLLGLYVQLEKVSDALSLQYTASYP